MRVFALLFTVLLVTPSAWAQDDRPSSPQQASSGPQDKAAQPQGSSQTSNLPVSLDKIKEALKQPPSSLTLRTLDEAPTFRVQILERQRIEELLATLNFKSSSPAPGGGLYGYEQQRQMFPAVNNPLQQPYAAFSQGELLTILIENLVGKYLAGRAVDAVSSAERAHAEAAAKEEVRAAVAQYCAAQPNNGAGIQICGTTVR
jgi:hypothetical protein